MRALAIAGAPTPIQVLSQVLAVERGATVIVLDDLRAAKLVQSVSGRNDDMVDIAHDRIRQVTRLSTSPEDARALHQQLALAFENVADSLRAASHWREAGHLHHAARHFAEAADRAAAALAFDRAVEHYQAALELGRGGWPDEKVRTLTLGLADALSNAGRGAVAAQRYLGLAPAAAGAGAGDAAARCRRADPKRTPRQGAGGRRQALADAGLNSPSAGAALIGQRVLLRVRGRRFRWRTLPRRSRPGPGTGRPLLVALVPARRSMDPVQGAHFQVRSLLLALRAGEPFRVARGIAGEAAYAAAQGQARRSRQLLTEASTIAATLADPHLDGIVAVMSGCAAHLLGEFGVGLSHLEAGSRTLRDRCVGTSWELDTARHFGVECLYYLGELTRFRSAAAEGLREANDRGSVYAATTLRTGLANSVWLMDDNPAHARHEATAAMSGWSPEGYHIQHWYGLIANTQIELYEGRAEEAHACIERAWPALAKSHLLRMQHTRIVALHLRARAALAAALPAGDTERARRLALARRCAERIGQQGRGWGPALAALIHAGALNAAGQREPGAQRLRAAIQEAASCGLALFRAGAQIVARDAHGDTAAGAEGERWMREQGVRAPASLARMLVPGFAAPAS